MYQYIGSISVLIISLYYIKVCHLIFLRISSFSWDKSISYWTNLYFKYLYQPRISIAMHPYYFDINYIEHTITLSSFAVIDVGFIKQVSLELSECFLSFQTFLNLLQGSLLFYHTPHFRLQKLKIFNCIWKASWILTINYKLPYVCHSSQFACSRILHLHLPWLQYLHFSNVLVTFAKNCNKTLRNNGYGYLSTWVLIGVIIIWVAFCYLHTCAVLFFGYKSWIWSALHVPCHAWEGKMRP